SEEQHDQRVEDKPVDVVADGDPGAAVGKATQLVGVVPQADPVAGVVLEALDERADGGKDEEGSHEDEGGSDPDPGSDLNPLSIGQTGDQELRSDDVCGQHHGYHDDYRHQRYEVCGEESQVHFRLPPVPVK